MAFDEGLGRGMPKNKIIGTGDDEYSLIGPGLVAPNQPPPYDPANDKQLAFDQGKVASGYPTGGIYNYRMPNAAGQGGFASILSNLLGKTYPSSPEIPAAGTGQATDSTTKTPDVSAQPDSGISPALTSVMRDSPQTGGSTIQAIMSNLLRRKSAVPRPY